MKENSTDGEHFPTHFVRRYAPAMITRKQFAKLKGGDLILWRGKYLRTILSGPADKLDQCGLWVDFSIRRRTWTNKAVTVYCFNDLRRHITYIGKKVKGIVLKSELSVLKSLRFDPRKELKRELKNERELAARMGRQLCSGFKRIERLAK